MASVDSHPYRDDGVTVSVLIHFATHFGQRLLLTGSLANASRIDDTVDDPPSVSASHSRVTTQCWLRFEADGRWRGVFRASRVSPGSYTYAYAVSTPGVNSVETVEAEWGPLRELDLRRLPLDCSHVELRDAWRPHAWATQLFRPLVTACAFQRTQGAAAAAPASFGPASVDGDAVRVTLQVAEARIPAAAKLLVSGSCASLGKWDPDRAVELSDAAYPTWSTHLAVAPHEWPVEYKYVLLQPDGSRAWEEGSNRMLRPPEYAARSLLAAEDAYLQTLRQRAVIPIALTADAAGADDADQLVLRPYDAPSFASRAAALRDRKPSSTNSISAIATLAAADEEDAPVDAAPAADAFVAASSLLLSPPVGKPVHLRQHDVLCRGAAFSWRVAGFSIPLFSLRTRASAGVGEYTDLPMLVDAAIAAGLRLIHMLPVNDTGVHMDMRDSCPYNTVSAFALHPLYISLQGVARLVRDESGVALSDDLQERMTSAQQQLNGDTFGALELSPPSNSGSMRRTTSETRFKSLREHQPLDYDAVLSLKLALLREVYRSAGVQVLQSRGFGRWFRDNRTWLQPYALFCFMRELHGTGEPDSWGSRRSITAAAISSMTDVSHFYYASIAFHYMVQYCAHVQLLQACTYAREQGVVLMVDIPAGMPRASVDVWSASSLFMDGMNIGAPPDAFAVDGQVWNAAPFDWAAGEAAVIAWWRARLTHLSGYFTAARLCHVETIFRTFVVAQGAVCGRGGVFQPARGYSAEELLRLADSLPALDRLTRPHIREWTVRAALGSQYTKMTLQFMTVNEDGEYAFLESFNTERKLREALQRTADEHLIMPLAQLLNNRVLVTRGSGSSTTYHPNVCMPSLTAYLELPHTQRCTLDALYSTYFGRETHDAWRATGLRRLRALLQHSPMLLFGDDFGMPGELTSIERFVGVAGTRSHRVPMGGGWGTDSHVTLPSSFEPETMAIPSTVDMAPLRSWWEEDTALAAKFAYALKGGDDTDAAGGVAAITDIVRAYLECPSAVVALLWQDAAALDARNHSTDPHAERINVPAVAAHYWRWRMPVPLEDVLASSSSGGMLAVLRRLVEAAGRR